MSRVNNTCRVICLDGSWLDRKWLGVLGGSRGGGREGCVVIGYWSGQGELLLVGWVVNKFSEKLGGEGGKSDWMMQWGALFG